VTDADCGAGEACVCGPLIGQCIQASCRSADDCGGYLCAQFYDLFGVGCGEPMELACQTPNGWPRSLRFCLQLLERIARDEQAHAELAWRFVAWALAERPELASLVERELVVEARALRLRTGEARVTSAFDLLPRGILGDAERRGARGRLARGGATVRQQPARAELSRPSIGVSRALAPRDRRLRSRALPNARRARARR
jgi:hypothetical protein